ncbi:hypothetical protein GCM10023193_04110 [Planotetraspora kaengkrachanensis]|uniref:Uncharacterized protein n=1 Tax=Planotetraspora kaengkrachanensis TaxID=575193 RepID=A0A8J3LQN5_9ACTN|nr:hypothetical protein Pka01_01490 [Planotetraspora kaengkrachanensis]
MRVDAEVLVPIDAFADLDDNADRAQGLPDNACRWNPAVTGGTIPRGGDVVTVSALRRRRDDGGGPMGRRLRSAVQQGAYVLSRVVAIRGQTVDIQGGDEEEQAEGAARLRAG